jgi:hypothetical protein
MLVRLGKRGNPARWKFIKDENDQDLKDLMMDISEEDLKLLYMRYSGAEELVALALVNRENRKIVPTEIEQDVEDFIEGLKGESL